MDKKAELKVGSILIGLGVLIWGLYCIFVYFPNAADGIVTSSENWKAVGVLTFGVALVVIGAHLD